MLRTSIGSFCRDEKGATAIEYGLIAALLAVAVIASFLVLGNTIENMFGIGAGGAANTIAAQVELIPQS